MLLLKRICSKCNEKKDLRLFIKNKTCSKGYCKICKTCQNKYSKQYIKDHAERLGKRRRELYHNSHGLSSKKRIKERGLRRERNKPFTTRARILRAGLLERNKTGIELDTKLFTTPYITKWLQSQPNCLCCEIKLNIKFKHDGKFHNDSPSLDRFNPKKGYVKGNVSLICWRCNNLKRDATSNELRTIADWMDVYGNDEKLENQPLEAFN